MELGELSELVQDRESCAKQAPLSAPGKAHLNTYRRNTDVDSKTLQISYDDSVMLS
jgi:hypothetical protein